MPRARPRRAQLALAVAAAFVAGCASHARSSESEPTGDAIACDEPRPELCTQDYRPVCALVDTGIRCVTTPCDSSEWRSFSNACSACAEPRVSVYRTGACEQER